MAPTAVRVKGQTLQELRCSECKIFLSCGPVFLRADGAAVCGRCPQPTQPFVRDKYYELAAKYLKFPCRYQELGCTKIFPFSEDVQHPHEVSCDYKPLKCFEKHPVKCDWEGQRNELLNHYSNKHSYRIMDNPCMFKVNLSKMNKYVFVLLAYDYLFFFYLKVFPESKKIMCALQLLGESIPEKDINYTVDLRKDSIMYFESTGQATTQNISLDKDNPSTIIMDISHIPEKEKVLELHTNVKLICAVDDCTNEIVFTHYRDATGWFCNKCLPPGQECLNKPQCTHLDIRNKCLKHEWFYCKQGYPECVICRKIMTPKIKDDLKVIICEKCDTDETVTPRPTYWKATHTGGQGVKHIINSTVGDLVCEYWLDDSRFEIFVRSPIISYKLSQYYCRLNIKDQEINIYSYILDVDFETDHDWHVEIKNIKRFMMDNMIKFHVEVISKEEFYNKILLKPSVLVQEN